MPTGMFRVKHGANRGWRGSSRGLAGSSAGFTNASLRQSAALMLAFGIALSACSSPEQMAEAAGVAAKATAAATATATGAPAGPVAFEDNAESNGRTREFAYKWPAAVSAIPALAKQLTDERDKALLAQKGEWQGMLSDPDMADCASCAKSSFAKEWKVVADLPRYLSLSASFYVYSGGAHGNSDFDALVWDREAGAAIAPEQMFASPEALQAALHPAWCKALLAERGKRLGAENASDGSFPCPPIADLTVLLGSSNKAAFDRIGLIAAPYVAGSYAEGPYEVTLPVTKAVIAALKPQYKAAFALAK